MQVLYSAACRKTGAVEHTFVSAVISAALTDRSTKSEVLRNGTGYRCRFPFPCLSDPEETEIARFCPVKQKQAVLRSNLPRDNWMRATKRCRPTPRRPKPPWQIAL